MSLNSPSKGGNYKKRRRWFILILLVLCGVGFIALATVSIISYQHTITPAGIIIHHSALPYAELESKSYLPLLNEIHKRRGYGSFYWGRTYYVGYHYIILPDGTVEKGRPDRCQGAHARGYNSYLGICLIGDFSTKHNPQGEFGLQRPTEAQMHSLVALCQNLEKQYAIISERIISHKDVNPDTECPGDRFPVEELFWVIKNR
jgi:N-acetylmuramoyl-L-alanine amidase